VAPAGPVTGGPVGGAAGTRYRHGVPKLTASERAKLPDSAFAYVDSKGRRRLPIHDEAHVRNALARFKQVRFENDEARERARTRLLNAAKRYGIVPVGFITGELRAQHRSAPALPTGYVTFLLTDIEDSTGLLTRLGDRYADVLSGVRKIMRGTLKRTGGIEVDARADELFAVFAQVEGALEAAWSMQRSLAERTWPDGAEVRVRMGVHSGCATLADSAYIGLPVHCAARICSAAHGGQVLVSGETRAAAEEPPPGLGFRDLGRHRLAGLPEPQYLFQLEGEGLRADFPPPRTRTAASRSAESPSFEWIGEPLKHLG
jgi:class 3 adenylate cyclase